MCNYKNHYLRTDYQQDVLTIHQQEKSKTSNSWIIKRYTDSQFIHTSHATWDCMKKCNTEDLVI